MFHAKIRGSLGHAPTGKFFKLHSSKTASGGFRDNIYFLPPPTPVINPDIQKS